MMATRTGTGPARRWPRYAVVLAAVLIAVALVAVYFASKPSPTPTATPPPLIPTVSRTTPPASVSGAPTVLADGCLGGTDPIKAIRIAHATAPLTPEGAAAFVATWARWQGQVPHDPAEYQQTGNLIWAGSLADSKRKTPTSAAGETAWVSTEQARYRVIDTSASDITIESLFTQTVSQDGANTQVEHVGRVTVTAVAGRWALKDIGAAGPDPEQLINQLQAEGLPYRGGC